MGAALGLLVLGEPTPLLLVSVPLGIVIIGGTLGIARGLAAGLEARVHRWVTDDRP